MKTSPRLTYTPEATPGAKSSPRSRTNDPERTMANIIEVGTKEFAEKGLTGARIDEIARAMKTSNRMIYY
jgi:AcrR family transcriptional regulator